MKTIFISIFSIIWDKCRDFSEKSHCASSLCSLPRALLSSVLTDFGSILVEKLNWKSTSFLKKEFCPPPPSTASSLVEGLFLLKHFQLLVISFPEVFYISLFVGYGTLYLE